MVKMPRFETFCLQTGFKTLVTETGQQLPPSIVCFNTFWVLKCSKYGQIVINPILNKDRTPRFNMSQYGTLSIQCTIFLVQYQNIQLTQITVPL